jgi:hypothetical protein
LIRKTDLKREKCVVIQLKELQRIKEIEHLDTEINSSKLRKNSKIPNNNAKCNQV